MNSLECVWKEDLLLGKGTNMKEGKETRESDEDKNNQNMLYVYMKTS